MSQLSLFTTAALPPPAAAPAVYLWVNITDLDQMGTMPGFGTPLNLMIRPELGDERQPGGWYNYNHLDEAYLIIKTSPERAKAIDEALGVLGKRKMKRAVRTKITHSMPGSAWRYISEP